jgi:hypothetical protein
MTAQIFVHELLCIALFFTVFCRAVKTDATVRADVRFAFFVLGIAACAGIVAPLAWAHQPNAYDLLLLGAVVLVQVITAHHWQHEVPPPFVKTQYRRTRMRRASDRAEAAGQEVPHG